MGSEAWTLQSVGETVATLRKSEIFRGGAANAGYSAAEYIVQPALLVVAAPFLVARLGLDQFGIWMLVSAIAGTVGVLSLGLGDATVKYVSAYRARQDVPGVARIFRAVLALSAAFGIVAALPVMLGARALVQYVFRIGSLDPTLATRAIQLGGVMLLLRSVDSVFVSLLRGHEDYVSAVRITVFVRVLTIAAAVVLAGFGFTVISILVASVGAILAGIVLLVVAAHRVLPGAPLWPSFDRKTWDEISHFGIFTWIQGVAAAVFNHADRLLIGALLGTAAVGVYSICVQATQPIHSLLAAGFNVLFPHLSSRRETGDARGSRRIYRLAVIANVFLSITLCLPFLLFGKWILTIWMGADFAAQAHTLLVLLAIAFALLSLNVTAHYTLLAFGRARFVAGINVFGGILSLGAAAALLPSLGLLGAAIGRGLYGVAALWSYPAVGRRLS